jgi:hypothetical protein
MTREMLRAAAIISAALVCLVAYSASRPDLAWTMLDDSSAPPARMRIERVGDKFERAVFDRAQYEVHYYGDEIWVQRKTTESR